MFTLYLNIQIFAAMFETFFSKFRKKIQLLSVYSFVLMLVRPFIHLSPYMIVYMSLCPLLRLFDRPSV